MIESCPWKFPLRLTLPPGLGAVKPGPDMLTGSASYFLLIFEPRRGEWECMACAETYGSGVKRFLSPGDVPAHAEAHQTGIDYALVLKKKGIIEWELRT